MVRGIVRRHYPQSARLCVPAIQIAQESVRRRPISRVNPQNAAHAQPDALERGWAMVLLRVPRSVVQRLRHPAARAAIKPGP